VALEERDAEFTLDLTEAPRERGLSEAEMARRGAKAALLGDGEDVTEMVELSRRSAKRRSTPPRSIRSRSCRSSS